MNLPAATTFKTKFRLKRHGISFSASASRETHPSLPTPVRAIRSDSITLPMSVVSWSAKAARLTEACQAVLISCN